MTTSTVRMSCPVGALACSLIHLAVAVLAPSRSAPEVRSYEDSVLVCRVVTLFGLCCSEEVPSRQTT